MLPLIRPSATFFHQKEREKAMDIYAISLFFEREKVPKRDEGMRAIIYAVLLLSTPAQAVEDRLSGAEIGQSLSDVTLTAVEGDKHISQIFQKAGVTLYIVNGQQSQGFWRVQGDKYCSQWPPHEQWDCYDMARDGKTIAFISSTGKRYVMLLPGAEN